MSYIELQGITFSYSQDEAPVLTDFSMSVKQGQCLVIAGDNGAGKTTLFRILNGLSYPQEGTYTYEGISIDRNYMKDNSHAKNFHKKVGFLFQNPDVMLFNGKVYDEIAFGPRQMGLAEEQVDMRTRDCMELFGISQLADKAPYHLSGGQKKKVALAAVMALNPEVLILDEPYAGLDQKSRVWLTDFLKELKAAGKTILMATHQEELIAELVDQRVVLE